MLRFLRSDPPGRAQRGQRRRTFGAALDQAENLWTAAAGIDDTAAPIVLFYALTQGARALCAAHLEGGHWEGAAGHGLRLLQPDAPGGAVPSLSAIRVKPQSEGFVQQVAGLLESPAITDEASLAELLCALPEHQEFLFLDATEHRPLQIHDSTTYHHSGTDPSNEVILSVGPLPSELERTEVAPEGYTRILPPTPNEISSWLSNYPSLARLGPPATVHYVNPMDLVRNPEYLVVVSWDVSDPISRGASRRWFREMADVIVSDEVGAGASGLALPSVGGNDEAIHPLIGWWIVLYSCSMLARYHPRTWAALLDVDRSSSAVPLSLILDQARSQLPNLLLRCLIQSEMPN